MSLYYLSNVLQQQWACNEGHAFMAWVEVWLCRNERPPVVRGVDDGVSMRIFKSSAYSTTYYAGGFRDDSLLPNVRRLVSGAEAPEFDTFEADDDPLSIINRRVSITTSGAYGGMPRTVLGTITAWNEAFLQHVIRHDSGDLLRYDLTSNRYAMVRLLPLAPPASAALTDPPSSSAPVIVTFSKLQTNAIESDDEETEDDVNEEDEDDVDDEDDDAVADATLKTTASTAAAPTSSAARPPPAPPLPNSFATAGEILAMATAEANASRLGAVLVENYNDDDDEEDRSSGNAINTRDDSVDDADVDYDELDTQSDLYVALLASKKEAEQQLLNQQSDEVKSEVLQHSASSDTDGLIIVQGADLDNQ